MTETTYRGSCHCQRVKFEVKLDLARGSTKCNCTYCTKSRNWGAFAKPDAFVLLSGKDELLDYQSRTNPTAHQKTCRHCGVRVYGFGTLEQLGGDYVSVQVACLDDVAPEALMAAPIQLCDGRNNAWWNPPAYSAHL